MPPSTAAGMDQRGSPEGGARSKVCSVGTACSLSYVALWMTFDSDTPLPLLWEIGISLRRALRRGPVVWSGSSPPSTYPTSIYYEPVCVERHARHVMVEQRLGLPCKLSSTSQYPLATSPRQAFHSSLRWSCWWESCFFLQSQNVSSALGN